MPRPVDLILRAAFGLLLALGLAGLGLLLLGPANHAPRVLAAQPAATPTETLDPAAWGSDHVEEDLPEYVEQGECLFCHRIEVGKTWQTDPHAVTVRDAEPDHPAQKALAAQPATAELAAAVQLLVGGDQHLRFARRSARFGQLELLDVGAQRGRGRSFRLVHAEHPEWLPGDHFAHGCAGCHTSGVDPTTGSFFALANDCFVCHGDVPLDHTEEAALVHLAKTRRDPPRVVTSICAQCHLRGGRSQSTGRPYATNFVAGDNLFRDFQVDWSLADNPELNPGDRHVWQNARDVVLYGRESTTCLSCHQVHGNDTKRHRDLPDGPQCLVCHEPGKPKNEPLRYEVHSDVCEY